MASLGVTTGAVPETAGLATEGTSTGSTGLTSATGVDRKWNRQATCSLENRQDISTARFAIRFGAPAGAALSIARTTAAFHPTCGNVGMRAATLS